MSRVTPTSRTIADQFAVTDVPTVLFQYGSVTAPTRQLKSETVSWHITNRGPGTVYMLAAATSASPVPGSFVDQIVLEPGETIRLSQHRIEKLQAVCAVGETATVYVIGTHY
jgi:hypothetical protein